MRLHYVFVLIIGLFVWTRVSSAQNVEMDKPDSTVEAQETNQLMDDTNPPQEVTDDDVNPIDANELADDENANAPQALAIIEGTKEDSEIYGEVEFIETKEGLMINAEVYNAPPGKHGIHVHENGSCEDGGNAAGGHFNPDGAQHGFLPKDGMKMAHAGDMGNIEINEDGEGSLSLVLPGVTLSAGKNSVVSKAVILHEKADDFGQPTGNAGGRIGCGLIELVTEE